MSKFLFRYITAMLLSVMFFLIIFILFYVSTCFISWEIKHIPTLSISAIRLLILLVVGFSFVTYTDLE